jgi:diketogulonate reductase-like aldo/keto reductase
MTPIRCRWSVFEDMYAAKKARAIGVSNYCQSCFECLLKTAKTVPMVNQVQVKTFLIAQNFVSRLIFYRRSHAV